MELGSDSTKLLQPGGGVSLTRMKMQSFPWKREYQFVEPGIDADGVRVYPFDPTFPIDVSFLVVAGPQQVRLNRHDFFEIIYAYSGSTQIQVLQRSLPMRQGDLVVMGPSLYHRILPPANREVRLVSLNFQRDLVLSGESDGESEQYLAPFVRQGADFPHVISGLKPLSRDAFEWILKVHAELPVHNILNRLAVKTYLKMLLLLLLRYYSDHLGMRDTLNRNERNLQRLQPLFELVQKQYRNPIEVADAARVCAMSCSHFMKVFKTATGQSFRAYLTSFRVAKAQSLLANSEEAIAAISEEVGFCSQSYFGEVFRDLVGMTPLAYRHHQAETSAPPSAI